jgi:hypothetical protein
MDASLRRYYHFDMRPTFYILAAGVFCTVMGLSLMRLSDLGNASYIISVLGVFVSACSLIPTAKFMRRVSLSVDGSVRRSGIHTVGDQKLDAKVSVQGDVEDSAVTFR